MKRIISIVLILFCFIHCENQAAQKGSASCRKRCHKNFYPCFLVSAQNHSSNKNGVLYFDAASSATILATIDCGAIRWACLIACKPIDSSN